MITATQLLAIMPNAGARADIFAVPLSVAMLARGIDTPARAAAFLAQIAHESGQLRLLSEVWGPTPAQRRYEGRADLGNVERGDGKRFLGRGLIQVTGRKNYLLCGFALDLDLIAHPELLERPDHAAASACWFWQSNSLNRYADAGDFVGLTRRINGGTLGIAERRAFWVRAKTALGATP